LVVLSYTPRAVNCKTPFVEDTRELYPVTKPEKALYVCNVVDEVVTVSVIVEVTGFPTEYCGPNGEGWVVEVVGTGVTRGKEVGRSVKGVVNVVKSMVSGPMSTTAVFKAALVVSRVNPAALNEAKGAAVPAG
jgi:hypothetical protein